jgi:hypothetical protein
MESIFTSASRIDKEAGIIHDVKILGRKSKNGREYSDQALLQASRLYEGIDVNLSHPGKGGGNVDEHGNAPVEQGFGWLASIKLKDDGAYGDLHYLKSHPNAPMVIEAAERNPKRFGMSHNARGNVKRFGNRQVVESMISIRSVDIVQNPATTNSLFESEEIKEPGVPIREVLQKHAPELLAVLLEDNALLPPEVMDDAMAPANPGEDAAATVKAACAQILTAMLDLPGNVAAMCTQLIAVCQKVIAGQPEPQPDPNADPTADPNKPVDPNAPPEPGSDPSKPAADSTAAQDPQAASNPAANPFEKRKKNMAESTKPAKSVEERLALLESENKTLREQVEFSSMEKKYTALLVEHHRDVLSHRLTALANAPDDAVRMELIEDWPSNKEPEPAPEPRRRPSFSAPIRESASERDLIKYPESHDSFVESLR